VCDSPFRKNLVDFVEPALSALVLLLIMKMRSFPRLLCLCLGFLFAFALDGQAASFSGEVSDLDAGNGYLTVTNPESQTTQTFKVLSETAIVTADGKPSQLLNLIEGTLVSVDVDPGDGKVAAKITVLPDAQEPP
jgi:hypothetical protein